MVMKNNDLLILDLLNSGRLRVDYKTGEVFSLKSNTPLKPLGVITPKGYLRTAFNIKGKRAMAMVHRIVCISAHGLPGHQEAQVNHLNGIKTDNRPCNLEWASQTSNMNHAKENGLLNPVKHERHYNAHLTASQITEIRESNKSTKELSLQFKVSTAHIRRIKTNTRWTNGVQNRTDNQQRINQYA